MKMCSDCKWYKAFGTESSDQCLHYDATSTVGGIRSESVVTHHTCEVMLKPGSFCADHRLFEVAI